MINYIYVFIVGGVICGISQILMEYLKFTPGIVTSLFVILGGFLECIGFYDKLIEIGSCGALIPITNFGSLVVKGSYNGIIDKGILGAFTDVYSTTGAGISVTIIIAFIVSIIFKPKE